VISDPRLPKDNLIFVFHPSQFICDLSEADDNDSVVIIQGWQRCTILGNGAICNGRKRRRGSNGSGLLRVNETKSLILKNITFQQTVNPIHIAGASEVHIHDCSFLSAPAPLSVNTRAGGNSSGHTSQKEGGRAILVEEGSRLDVFNSRFVAHSAAGERALGQGGAIHASGRSRLALRLCDFESNVATEGGAVFVTDNTRLDIDRCNFTANWAWIRGGALCSSLHSQVNIHTSRFVFNRAYNEGGALASILL
jgi:hypothetical protein